MNSSIGFFHCPICGEMATNLNNKNHVFKGFTGDMKNTLIGCSGATAQVKLNLGKEKNEQN